ncbi:MAG: 4-(cytidine 5'-diphospho)-2-C-methyl-D-erythritol kinase [Magnetococcales bacterium]|nr:4-(cytidine 5'-diphospho)-2-C-methyl-D-erythritol kinase [Magnetococcales bacterium]
MVPCFSAPAKVNLMLRVVGRRPDGYHLLKTVMTFFPWQDRLTFLPGGDTIQLACHPPVTRRPEENLVYRAAASLCRACGIRRGVNISLEKTIPDGAGLGGGSSDAATTLLALNRLWHLDLALTDLLPIGLALGADVPIFLGGQAALAEGVGELLTPLPNLPLVHLVVVHPGVGLSTQKVFGLFAGQLTNRASPISIPSACRGEDVFGDLENDLESVAVDLAPVVGQALSALRGAGASAARMSGSGTAVFGVFASLQEAAIAAQGLAERFPGWRVVHGATRNAHPFAAEWERYMRSDRAG